uniref:Uncharacterized protein n=1 Tax=Odontella aurita TaxID=265563 RepID=A0A7S4NIV1_9STRA|mmetsp:Transcript_82/g.144  ORF Transcript_82/g.144 Transcript_82/m.144 type:complete len:423 (+) Transcript_82:17-1285(+)
MSSLIGFVVALAVCGVWGIYIMSSRVDLYQPHTLVPVHRQTTSPPLLGKTINPPLPGQGLRFAISLSGTLRYYKQTHNHFMENLVKHNRDMGAQTDVFMAIADSVESWDSPIPLRGKHYEHKMIFVNKSEIVELYRPRDIFWNGLSLGQTNRMGITFQMIKAIERKQNETYDVVLRVRSDTFFATPYNLVAYINNNKRLCKSNCVGLTTSGKGFKNLSWRARVKKGVLEENVGKATYGDDVQTDYFYTLDSQATGHFSALETMGYGPGAGPEGLHSSIIVAHNIQKWEMPSAKCYGLVSHLSFFFDLNLRKNYVRYHQWRWIPECLHSALVSSFHSDSFLAVNQDPMCLVDDPLWQARHPYYTFRQNLTDDNPVVNFQWFKDPTVRDFDEINRIRKAVFDNNASQSALEHGKISSVQSSSHT